MPDEGPTGNVVVDDDAAGERARGALERWLRPGPRRPLPAGLLVAAAVVSTVVAGPFLGLPLGSSAASWQLGLWLVGVVTNLALMGALAGFVWAGSRAGRVLGAVVALGGSLQLVIPVLVLQVPPGTFGAYAVAYLGAAAMHVAAFVALLVPPRR